MRSDPFQRRAKRIGDKNFRYSMTLQSVKCNSEINPTSCSHDPSFPVTIVNKIGAFFQLDVAAGLTLKGVIIDSADSTLLYKSDAWATACHNSTTACCAIVTDSLIKTSSNQTCTQASDFSNKCVYTGVRSMFQFREAAGGNAGPGTLTLDSVTIKNLFYDIHSIVGLGSVGGHVVIKDSAFERNSFCGGFIVNKVPILVKVNYKTIWQDIVQTTQQAYIQANFKEYYYGEATAYGSSVCSY